MNLQQLEAELLLYVQDDTLAEHFREWINNAVLEIANDFALPALRLKVPTTLTVTESDWLYDMSDTYQKNLFKCYDSDWSKITIKRSLGDIDTLDIDHDETGSHVTHVSVQDAQIGIFPMAAEDIKLWFYKKPTELANGTDKLTCIPDQYHSRVIIPKIVIQCYHLLMDMSQNPPHQSLSWWNGKYRAGLFGDASDIGMINCLARDRKPRRTGGRCPLP